MAGGIILSRRLERMQNAAKDFGDSYAEIGDQQRKRKLEDEDRKAAADERALRMRGLKNDVDLSDITFGRAKEQEAGRVEAQGLAGELAGFGQAVPENEIDTGGLGDFQPQQSMRPVSDTTAQSLQDRIRASWMNADAKSKGETSAFTAADVQRQRAEAAESKRREGEKASLDLDKTRADIESTKAGTGGKLMDTKKTAMEMKKLQAEIDAIGKGGMDPEKAIVAEGKLRDSYLGQNKGFLDVHDAYGRVMASVKDPSPAGDLALIFNYMKMLDPGSTVREGEFATAEEAGSIPSTIINKYNKALSGERLGETRSDFIKQAANLYEAAQKNYARNQKTFTNLATSYKLDPSRVVIPLENEGMGAKPTAPAAAAGGKPDKRALAQEALNDPDAPEEVKARARQILGQVAGASGKF